MKINVEASGMKMGVDNAITEAIISGNWGLRVGFHGDEHDSRYEVILSIDEAKEFITNIDKAISSIGKVKHARRNK